MMLTSTCVCVTITAVKKHQVYRIRTAYSLMHPACNVQSSSVACQAQQYFFHIIA